MKLIKQSYEILEQEIPAHKMDDYSGSHFREEYMNNMYKHIEKCGRTCYKSEDKITEGSAKRFVEGLIKSKHLSVLEHGVVYLCIEEDEPDDYGRINYCNKLKGEYYNNPYSKVKYFNWKQEPNIVQKHWCTSIPRTTTYITTNYRVIIENGWEEDLQFLCTPDEEYHELRHTVLLHGCIHTYKDLTRHRKASFSIESTRYCVSGDTLLTYKNPRNSYTIKDLYEDKISTNKLSNIIIETLDTNTGKLEYSKIKNIFNNGIKPVYKITTRLGYTLKCTNDHKIYTPNGWEELQNLKVNDFIYVNGQDIEEPLYKDKDWLYNQNITLNKTFVQIGEEFGFNVSTLKKWGKKLGLPSKGTGYFNVGKTPWNKGLKEGDDPRVDKQIEALRTYHHSGKNDNRLIIKEDTSEYQKYCKENCEVCGSTDKLQVHHIDHDRTNNYPDNLLTVCPSCHQRIHEQSLKTLYSDKIVSIEYVGEEEVFDLEIDNYHNYVANGIIVHNCNYSKTDKFGEMKFVEMPWVLAGNDDWDQFVKREIIRINDTKHDWKYYTTSDGGYILSRVLNDIEDAYNKLIQLGWQPQQAAEILPQCTAADIIMTAYDSDWKFIFDLRSDTAVTGKPHPLVEELMTPLRDEFKEKGWI